jgi:osmoprotectant transport system substrate-binding protein
MTIVRSCAAAFWAVLALACAACGSSIHQGSRPDAPVPASASTTSTSTTSTSTTTTTSSTTTSTSTSTSTTNTVALPGTGKPVITIGDKNFTEQFVLGQLYLQALKAAGFTVNVNANIGPTDVTLRALASGALTLYPEYLDTWNTTVAGDPRHFRTQFAAYEAAQRYALAHGLALLDPTPFSDTSAIGVTVGYAAANHLRSIRDLRWVATTLTLGGPPQFQQSPTGLPAIQQVYGVTPAAFKPLAVGDQYPALNNGSVQAADLNTTDGELASGDYTLLRDPRTVFGWGNVVPVVSVKALSAEGPAFATTINRVDGLLTRSVMRQLNADVDVSHQDPAAVAKQFLQTHGLIPLPQS